MENLQNQPKEQVVANGSDVEMIEVNSPNFFERHFLHILTIFGVGFLIFTFIFQIYLTPIYIVGRSMQPTINSQSTGSNDLINCDLVYYKRQSNFNRGDIIVADASDYLTGQTDPIIKRVIATGGDTLTFDFYQVDTTLLLIQDLHIYKCYYKIYLNGELLTEDYIAQSDCFLEIKTNTRGEYIDSSDYLFLQQVHSSLYKENSSKFIEKGTVDITVPQNTYFICGDNRNHSTDSRYFGAVKNSDILGVMALHIPYGTNLFVGIWRAIFN